MSSVFVVVSLSCFSHGFRCKYLFYLAFDVLPNPLFTVHIITTAHNNYLNHVHLTIYAQYTASRQLNTSLFKVIWNKNHNNVSVVSTVVIISYFIVAHLSANNAFQTSLLLGFRVTREAVYSVHYSMTEVCDWSHNIRRG